jgi:hypothetical protein
VRDLWVCYLGLHEHQRILTNTSVTNWTFTFEGHKGCGDWQAAMGITFRVHHLTWVTRQVKRSAIFLLVLDTRAPGIKSTP